MARVGISSNSDILVVSTKQLAEYLQKFIDEIDASAGDGVPLNLRSSKKRPISGLSYVTWQLEIQFGYVKEGEQSESSARRMLYRILKAESKFTGLTLADQIVTIMERPDLLGNEILVVPNPYMSTETWREYAVGRGCDPEGLM
jgi:hypothetical protein